MTASVSLYVLYYFYAVIVEFRLDWFLSGNRSLVCTVIYTSKTSSMLLMIGVTLSLAKWFQFLFRI